MNRDDPFSYQCNGCGRCCYHKRIQVNPYEVLRLSRILKLTTGKFIQQYLEVEGPYLRATPDGACIFLSSKGCGVHAGRPLACRTYPLGRFVDAEAQETFELLNPHPESEGVYGTEGAIAQYLQGQGEAEFSAAADRYQQVFYRLFDALQNSFIHDNDTADEIVAEAAESVTSEQENSPSPLHTWLDVDSTVKDYCLEHNITIPEDFEEILNLHCLAIDQQVNQLIRNNS